MAQLVLRPVKISDLSAIEEVNAAVQPHPWSHQSLVEELNHPQLLGIVALENEKLCGYLLCRFDPPSAFLEIMTLGVMLEFQRHGVAQKLFSKIFENVTRDDAIAATVFLEVSANNQAATSLYEKFGFKLNSVRTKYYRDGSDALVYKLHLAKTQ